jgi:hypothetical protein
MGSVVLSQWVIADTDLRASASSTSLGAKPKKGGSHAKTHTKGKKGFAKNVNRKKTYLLPATS